MQSNELSEAVQLLANNGFKGMGKAMHLTPRVDMRKQDADHIRNIFNATNAHHAQKELRHFVDRYQETAPKLAAWGEVNLAEA
jgi:hypothetical protein